MISVSTASCDSPASERQGCALKIENSAFPFPPSRSNNSPLRFQQQVGWNLRVAGLNRPLLRACCRGSTKKTLQSCLSRSSDLVAHVLEAKPLPVPPHGGDAVLRPAALRDTKAVQGCVCTPDCRRPPPRQVGVSHRHQRHDLLQLLASRRPQRNSVVLRC